MPTVQTTPTPSPRHARDRHLKNRRCYRRQKSIPVIVDLGRSVWVRARTRGARFTQQPQDHASSAGVRRCVRSPGPCPGRAPRPSGWILGVRGPSAGTSACDAAPADRTLRMAPPQRLPATNGALRGLLPGRAAMQDAHRDPETSTRFQLVVRVEAGEPAGADRRAGGRGAAVLTCWSDPRSTARASG